MSKDAYSIIKTRYVTEKSTMLQSLQTAESNASLRKCQSPKYVFLVDPRANKIEIARAVEEIYKEQKVQVCKVNVITVKPKKKRTRGRQTYGSKSGFKKAIVTLEPGDVIE